MDQGIYGHLTLRNLAVLATERGDLEEAERLWRAVLAECPGDKEGRLATWAARPRVNSRRFVALLADASGWCEHRPQRV